jgi:hypothetical protein
MAILFMEGFDGHASVAEVFADPRFSFSGVTSEYKLQTGRSGSGNCLEVDAGGDDFTCILSQATGSTIWIQFAYYFDQDPGASDVRIVQIYDNSGVLQGTLALQLGSNTVTYHRGDYNGTLLATSPSALGAATWYYLELKVVIDDSAGSVYLKIDGVEEMNVSAVDTNNGGVASVSSVRFGRTASSSESSFDGKFDDIVIGDTSDGVGGSPSIVATDLIGDCSIEVLFPDGAGNYAQWTPSTGLNYQNVDEGATNDGDTTYNSSSTAAQRDSFTCDDLSISTGSVYAVQVTNICRREDGGGRLFRGTIRTSSTDAEGTGKYMPATYAHKTDIFENDASGSDWTVSSVNAMEIGYELET